MLRWTLLAVVLVVLAGGVRAGSTADDKISVLILTGENNHDWKKTTPVLRQGLEASGRFSVTVSERPGELGGEDFAKHKALVLNYNGKSWGERTNAAFLEYVTHGGGVVVVHAANNAFGGWKEYDKVIGGAWRAGAGHGAQHRFTVAIKDAEHPITAGMPKSFMHANDELYHNLTMQPGIHMLATAFDDKGKGGTGKDEPMAWVLPYGKGRVFHTPMGHGDYSMKGAGFRAFLERGTEWAATGKVTIALPKDLNVEDATR